MALRRQVVDLVGSRLLDDADEIGGIGQVTVMQEEAHPFYVRIAVQVVDSCGVERGRTPLNPMHYVTFAQQ